MGNSEKSSWSDGAVDAVAAIALIVIVITVAVFWLSNQ